MGDPRIMPDSEAISEQTFNLDLRMKKADIMKHTMSYLSRDYLGVLFRRHLPQ